MFNQFGLHEEAFAIWRRDGMPGLSDTSWKYVDALTDPADDTRARDGTLWPHQWEAFLRVVYAHEVLGRKEIGASGLLLNIVTGGGKTALIAALIAWMRVAHGVSKFLLLCPNLIVKDRLEQDFAKGKVFEDRDLLPAWAGLQAGDFEQVTLGGGSGGYAGLLSANVVVGNIHQFYGSHGTGQSNLAALMNGPNFAIFNDEAHNSGAPEYEVALRKMRPKTLLRVDTTATPDRADGTHPDSDLIYEYGVQDALVDRIIKAPVVYQPDIATVQLTYTDAKTGERRRVEEIDWDEVDRLGLSATQWVTDDEPMRQQIAIALQRLKEQEARAKGRFQPILFVVAVCKADAEKAERTLMDHFKLRTLLVTEDSDEADRQKARELSRQKTTGNPYKAVVSVLMLREGWDVPEVGVILLLRKFSSRVYGQQVIGRGLRRVRTKGLADDEPQICAAVDHPKLEHDWLWAMFNARRRTDVQIDQLFDETEDLPELPPKQELVKPDKVIDVPPPDPTVTGEFDVGEHEPPPEPMKAWRLHLDMIEYEPTVLEITGVDITGVVGQELVGEGWKTVHSSPETTAWKGAKSSTSDAEVREMVKSKVLEVAEELTTEAGYATAFKDRVYSGLMQHVRRKFMRDLSLGLADRADIDYAWKMLPQVKPKVAAIPGLVAGMIEHDDQ